MPDFFKLQQGEKVIADIKPLPALRNYYLATWLVILLVSTIWILWMPFFIFPPISGFSIVLMITLVAIIWIVANKKYQQQYYWITNKRIVSKRGLIGYRVSSIPLERVSDVIVSRTFAENLFGFGSVMVQSLAGQFTPGRHLGAEGSLMAIPDPEGTQQQIFELIKKKRKAEHITM